MRGWGRGAGRGPVPAPPSSGTCPGGGTPAHSPPLFISVVSMLCQPTLPRVLLPPTQPATCSPRASSCIFDKVIGIFLLTGLSLHFTCSFPRLTASSGQQAWFGSPSPCQGWGRTHQFLFILSLDFPVVEGKADVRRGRGLRRQCWGPRDQGEGGEYARDRSDLLALGSPAQDPSPAPKASTAPRP